MAEKQGLSDLKIKALTWSGRLSSGGKPLADVHADNRGLMLSVSPTAKSWVLRLYLGGKERRVGLGTYPELGLKEARAKAESERVQTRKDGQTKADRGRSDRSARAAAAEQAKADRDRVHWTLARCARDYHERVVEPTRTAKHAAQWISSLENHVPAALWHRAVADITAPELLAALLDVKPHERARNLSQGDHVQETVQRIRQRLDAVFEDAGFHGRCTSNPAAAIRRKLREATPSRQRGEFKALPYAEASTLVAQLRHADGTAARCLEFAMLTAARTSEAIGAAWAEIDLQAATWVIPKERMKANEPHLVPLSPRAVEILRAQLGQDAQLVFPSPMTLDREDGDRKPLSNMALLTLLGRMDYRHRTTVHGLCRATLSTWANETGAARPDVIEACLAHEESNRVRAAYNRAKFNEERRALLMAWADYLAVPPAPGLPFTVA